MQHLLNDLRVLRAHAGLMQSDAAYAAFIHSSIKRDADESCTPERNVRPRVDMGVLLSAFEQMAVKNLNPLANLLLAFDATPMDVRKWQRLSTALGERITILINGLGATDKPLWKTLYKKCFYNKPEDEGPLALPFHLRRKHAPNAEVPITWERLWWIHYERTWYWIRNFSVKAVIAQRPEVVVELTQEPKEIETCEQAYEVTYTYDDTDEDMSLEKLSAYGALRDAAYDNKWRERFELQYFITSTQGEQKQIPIHDEMITYHFERDYELDKNCDRKKVSQEWEAYLKKPLRDTTIAIPPYKSTAYVQVKMKWGNIYYELAQSLHDWCVRNQVYEHKQFVRARD